MIEAGRPKTQREVAYYAKELNVTSKYLSDTIIRVTGQSISSHINNAATSIIIEYLKYNQLSITQIADEMNFTSVSYFSRYWTKHIGISPAQYRLAGAKNKAWHSKHWREYYFRCPNTFDIGMVSSCMSIITSSWDVSTILTVPILSSRFVTYISSSGYWHYKWFLGEHPCQRNLCGSGFLCFSHLP